MSDIVKSIVAETLHYSETGGDFAGRMRKWIPVSLKKSVNCNRPDLWEAFEQTGKAKRILPKSKAGMIAGIFAFGAAALSCLGNDKLSFVA